MILGSRHRTQSSSLGDGNRSPREPRKGSGHTDGACKEQMKPTQAETQRGETEGGLKVGTLPSILCMFALGFCSLKPNSLKVIKRHVESHAMETTMVSIPAQRNERQRKGKSHGPEENVRNRGERSQGCRRDRTGNV